MLPFAAAVLILQSPVATNIVSCCYRGQDNLLRVVLDLTCVQVLVAYGNKDFVR